MTTISQIGVIATVLTAQSLLEIEQDGVSKQITAGIAKEYLGGGLPGGGTTDQVLTKNSNTNGDATWKDAPKFKNYYFNPSVEAPAIFVAEEPQSIVTPTTLTSTNVGAPLVPTANIPFAMMTAAASSGNLELTVPLDNLAVRAVFHDGTFNESNVISLFNDPTNPRFGAIVGLSSTEVTLRIGATTYSGVPTGTTVLIGTTGSQITTGLGTGALNTALFPFCTVTVFVETGVIGTLTYANTLVGRSAAPLPVAAKDGDALIIEGLATSNTTFNLLGSTVKNGNYCVLIDNNTAIRVMQDLDFAALYTAAILDSINNGVLQPMAQNEDYILTPNGNNYIETTRSVVDTTITLEGLPSGTSPAANCFYNTPTNFRKGRLTFINQTAGVIKPIFDSIPEIIPVGWHGEHLATRVAPFTVRCFNLIRNATTFVIQPDATVMCSLEVPEILSESCVQAAIGTTNVSMSVNGSILQFRVEFNTDIRKAREGMRIELVATGFPIFAGAVDRRYYYLTAADIANGYAIVDADQLRVQAVITNVAQVLNVNVKTALAFQQPEDSINYDNGRGLYTGNYDVGDTYTITVT